MGCCGNNKRDFLRNSNELLIELLTLDSRSDSSMTESIFTVKSLGKEKIIKNENQTLLKYIEESQLIQGQGQNFELNNNNSLFYCYINANIPIVKNYIQIKTSSQFAAENIYKISILLTKNFDKLDLPKIYLINETKFLRELSGITLNFSELYRELDCAKNPNLSCDNDLINMTDFEEYIDYENGIINTNLNDENEKYTYRVTENVDYDSVKKLYMKLAEGKDILENKNYTKEQKYLFLQKDVVNIVDEDILEGNSISSNNIKNERNSSSIDKDYQLENYDDDENNSNSNQIYKKIKITKPKNSQKDIKKVKNQEIFSTFYFENINGLDLEAFKAFVEILIGYPFLIKFGFVNSPFDKDDKFWNTLIKLIDCNYNIRGIDLHNINVNNEIIESLYIILSIKRIRYLDLSENFIGSVGAEYLSHFLKENKTLQKLNLSNNDLRNFKSSGVGFICDSLMNHPNILMVNFSSMCITGCGEKVAELIKNTKTIQTINLHKCSLNAKDIHFICNALSSENISSTIKNVNLSYNDLAGDKSIEDIGNMIKKNKCLSYLNMNKMNLNSDNYKFIFDGLDCNNLIENFSFCFNTKIKPKIILNYFFQREKLKSLIYVPYKEDANEGEKAVEFNLEEKKIIEKFKNERNKVKLIYK